MMVLAGLAMLRIAKGDDSAPLLLHADAAARLRADEHRHAGAAARPDAPAVRLAHLHHLPGQLADGLGLVGADHRLRRAAGLGADPPARRLALAGPHACRCCSACPTRIVARPSWIARAGLGQHRAGRRPGHLHRHPAQHHGGAAAVEQRHPRPPVPGLGPVGRRRGDAHRRHAAARAQRAAGHDRRRLLGHAAAHGAAAPARGAPRSRWCATTRSSWSRNWCSSACC